MMKKELTPLESLQVLAVRQSAETLTNLIDLISRIEELTPTVVKLADATNDLVQFCADKMGNAHGDQLAASARDAFEKLKKEIGK